MRVCVRERERERERETEMTATTTKTGRNWSQCLAPLYEANAMKVTYEKTRGI